MTRRSSPYGFGLTSRAKCRALQQTSGFCVQGSTMVFGWGLSEPLATSSHVRSDFTRNQKSFRVLEIP